MPLASFDQCAYAVKRMPADCGPIHGPSDFCLGLTICQAEECLLSLDRAKAASRVQNHALVRMRLQWRGSRCPWEAAPNIHCLLANRIRIEMAVRRTIVFAE